MPEEPTIGQFLGAHPTAKAFGMPVRVHGFDHPTNDKFAAFAATRCKEHVEIMFAVFAPLELVINSVWEGSEALRASKIRVY